MSGHSIGFVPTMGFLARGAPVPDLAAASENDLVVVSIFVNPLQFNPGEDFEDYPRDLRRDLRMCGAAGAGIVFAPEPAEMYRVR